MLVLVLCAALIAVVMFPETQIGKALRRLLIEAPAQALSRVTPGWVVLALIVLGAGALVAMLFEAEGLRLLGMALPEGLVWVATFDVATFLDLFAAAAMIAAAARLRGLRDAARSLRAWTRTRTRVWRVARRTGRNRRRSRRPAARPNDDDRPAWAGWSPAWA